jgi:hypothetical protein
MPLPICSRAARSGSILAELRENRAAKDSVGDDTVRHSIPMTIVGKVVSIVRYLKSGKKDWVQIDHLVTVLARLRHEEISHTYKITREHGWVVGGITDAIHHE